jgi:hypothetical protein
MGKRAILVEIAPEVFERVLNDGEVKQEEFGKNTFLNTTWLQLNNVLQNAKSPLNLAISGNFHPAYSQKGLDEFINQNSNPYYISFSSPEMVTSIAEGFSSLPESDLLKLGQKAKIEIDENFFRYYGELRNAYIYASLNGNALSIIIA